MTEPEIIEGEVAELVTSAVERYEAAPPANLFRTEEPVEIIRRATEYADALSNVLRSKGLIMTIGKGEHVLFEGWTLLGGMLGISPIVEWTRPLADGWEARVVAQKMDGTVVGAAEAQCLRSERHWKSAEDYAIRSMAQTRAASKALRQPLGFVVSLAGFNPTPAEEMPRESATGDYGAGEEERVEPSQVFAPKGWKQLEQHFRSYSDAVWEDWRVFGAQARAYLFPDEEELTKEQKDTLWVANFAAAEALLAMTGPGDFPPPKRAEMQTVWKAALDMEEDLAGPPWRMSPDEEDRSERST